MAVHAFSKMAVVIEDFPNEKPVEAGCLLRQKAKVEFGKDGVCFV